MAGTISSSASASTGRGRDRRSLWGRMRAWAIGRHGKSDSLTLSQRNIYILPTRAGLVFAATVLVLLLASVNYQRNLGYVLTFLLAGSGIVSMHVTHGTLRGLSLHLRPPSAAFAGDSALLDLVLTNAGKARFGIGLRLGIDSSTRTIAWVDVPAASQVPAQLSFVPDRRGRHDLPPIQIETRFPLGLFRAWSVWRPASPILVYPQPEQPAAPWPAPRSAADGSGGGSRSPETGEFDGVRSYQRGDPPKVVVWKQAAKALARGSSELVSRDSAQRNRRQLWLDWSACAPLEPEGRLSRLAAWVIAAERQGLDYGLRLPARELGLGSGEAHKRACLQALALWS